MSASQQSLLAILDRVQSVPRSRSSHPGSSERAEIKARASRKMRGQALEVLEMLKLAPGKTSKELAVYAATLFPGNALDRYQIARRLPELLAANLVTRTDSDVESRWWPV